MARTLVTRAVIQGVDNLSGPLRRMAGQVAAIQGRFAKARAAVGRFTNTGSGGLAAMTAPMASAAFLRDQYTLEQSLNRSRAILDLTKEQFKPLEDEIIRLGATYPLTMKDAAKASVEFGQAGLAASTQIAVFEQAVKGAMASGISVEAVAAGVTDVVMGLGLPFRTAAEQAESFRRVNDLLAASAVSANQTYEGFLAGFRKAAPVAAAVGVSMEETAVYLGALANAGIKAEKAGTALRTLFIRPLAPTKKALGLLKSYGIELNKFTSKAAKWEPTGAKLSGIFGQVMGTDLTPLVPDIDKMLNDPAIRGNVSATQQKLTEFLLQRLGAQPGTEDASKIADAVSMFVTSGLTKIDFKGLLSEMANKNVGIDLWKEMFGLRHIEKGLALGSQLMSKQLDDLTSKLATKLQYQGGKGPVDRFMEIMQSGFPGSVDRLRSAFDMLVRTIATAGTLDTVTGIFDRLKDSVVELSKTNPQLLKWAALGTLAAGALAPLGLVIGGIAMALGPMAAVAGAAAVGFTRFAVAAGALAASPFLRASNWLRAAAVGLGLFGAKAAVAAAHGARLARGFAAIARWTGIGTVIAVAIEALTNWKQIANLGSSEGFQQLVTGFQNLGTALAPLGNLLSSAADGVKAFFGVKADGSLLVAALELIAKVIGRIADGFATAINKVNEFFGAAQKLQQLPSWGGMAPAVPVQPLPNNPGDLYGRAMKPQLQSAPQPFTRDQLIEARSGGSVTVQGGYVETTMRDPLRLDGQIGVDVQVQAQNAQATSTVKGNIRGPANAVPVRKTNGSALSA